MYSLKTSATAMLLATSANTAYGDSNSNSNTTTSTSASSSASGGPNYSSSAGAYDEFGLGRSSNNLQTMLWMVCNRNEKCKGTLDKDDFLNLLKDYGCNCFPSAAAKAAATDARKIWYHHKNNNAPMDDLDYECQKVAQAYTCMDMDANEGKLIQVGKHGCYHGMVFDYHFDFKELICGPRHNVDYLNVADYREQDCKKASCEIERNFALRAMEIMDYDPVAFLAANADKKGACSRKKTIKKNPIKDDCCGDFPNRMPYNNMLNECCEDGTSSRVGMCAGR